jgi:hypothetical protein
MASTQHKPEKHSSAVWSYFNVNPVCINQATCTIVGCGVSVGRGTSQRCFNTTNMRNHIQRHHKKEFAELEALEKAKACSDFRKMGILKTNKKRISEGKDQLEAERQVKLGENLVMCGTCSGFYSKKHFRRHADNCRRQRDLPATTSKVGLPAVLLAEPQVMNDAFTTEVLARFAADEVGRLCITNIFIKNFGQREFSKSNRKKEKKVEVRRSTMRDMR